MMEHFRTAHNKLSHSSFLEVGTVQSASPLVISVDIEGITLEWDQGDFIMPDNLILYSNDRVLLSRMSNPHLYSILYRLRGTLPMGQAAIGDRSNLKAVARVGDTVAGGVITTGSSKVKVE